MIFPFLMTIYIQFFISIIVSAANLRNADYIVIPCSDIQSEVENANGNMTIEAVRVLAEKCLLAILKIDEIKDLVLKEELKTNPRKRFVIVSKNTDKIIVHNLFFNNYLGSHAFFFVSFFVQFATFTQKIEFVLDHGETSPRRSYFRRFDASLVEVLLP